MHGATIRFIAIEHLFARRRTLSDRPYVTSCATSFNTKQDRQFTYNVTMWRGRITIVAVKTQQRILCVCVVHFRVTGNCIKILSVVQQQ